MINQKNEGVMCIYVAIGQKRLDCSVATELAAHKALEQIIVTASASDSAAFRISRRMQVCVG